MRWGAISAAGEGAFCPPLFVLASSFLDSSVLDAARRCLEASAAGHAWDFADPDEDFELLCALVAEHDALLGELGDLALSAELEGAPEALAATRLRRRWLDWVVGGLAATLWVPGACSFLRRGLSRIEDAISSEERSAIADLARETILYSDHPLEALPLVEDLAMDDEPLLLQAARVRGLRLGGAPQPVWQDQMKDLLLRAGPPLLRGGIRNPVIDSLAPELAESVADDDPQLAIPWMHEWLRLYPDLGGSFRSLSASPRKRARFACLLLFMLRLYVETGDDSRRLPFANTLIHDLGLGDAPLDPARPEDSTVLEHAAASAGLLDGRSEVVLIEALPGDKSALDPSQLRSWISACRQAADGAEVLLAHGQPTPITSARTRRSHRNLGAALEKELRKQLEESRSNGQGNELRGPFPCETFVFGDGSSRHPSIWFTPADSNGDRWAVGVSIGVENSHKFSYRLRVGRAARGPSTELAAALAAPRPASVGAMLEEVDRLLKRAREYL